MKRLWAFFVSLLYLLCYYCAAAQDYPTLHFTKEDGLPSNTIYNIYRDSKNFLWVATDKGIARYNGIRFESFTTTNGLPDNEVFFFQEDYFGRLWLGTYNGELCYYKDGIFHTGENTPFLKLKEKHSYLRRITSEYDSSITVILNDFRVFLNIKGDHVEIVNLADSFKAHNILNILFVEKTGADRYKLYRMNEILTITSKGAILNRVNNDIGKGTLPESWGGSMAQNQHYTFCNKFIRSLPGLKVKKYLNDTLFEKYAWRSVYFDHMGCFLMTNKGIVAYDSLLLLKGMDVNCITQDMDSNYWVGTGERGIFVFSKNFLNTKMYYNAYAGKVQYAARQSGHTFFATTENKLNLFEKGSVRCLLNYNSLLVDRTFSLVPGFYIDSNNSFYYFNRKAGLSVADILSPHLAIQTYRYQTDEAVVIKEVSVIGNTVFLNAKRYILNLKVGSKAKMDEPWPNIISDTPLIERVYCMAKSPDNFIWYSKAGNIYKTDGGVGKIQLQFKGIEFKSLDFFGPYLVGYTHNNRLLVCANYNKVPKIDSLPQRNGVWDKLYKIDETHVLISTNNLYRLLTLDTSDVKHCVVRAIENPFLPLDIEAFSSDGDKCYFFKNGSIATIGKSILLEGTGPPQLHFSSVRTSDSIYSADNEIYIPYNRSKNISISFSTISFGGVDIAYQYSVSKNEQDTTWSDISGEEISLAHPGYGDYIVKVRGKTRSSVYSIPVALRFKVLKPYWATGWFVFLCVLIGLVITGLLVRLRILFLIRKNKKEHDNEIKFMKSEYKAINALMNPHFIFNTLNNVQSLFNANDKLAANEYLRIFADLIRQNMHNVSKELIPLQKEVALVMNYLMLEKLRFEDRLNYNIKVDEKIDLSEIMIPPLLIQPLVENSIKHGILPLRGDKGIIELCIYERNDRLYIEVRDNGLGMDNSKMAENDTHESFGIQGIKTRIEKLSMMQGGEILFHAGAINDEHGNHAWTVVTVSMPM